MHIGTHLVLVLAVALTPASSFSQELLLERTLPGAVPTLSNPSIANIGDVDGDNIDDLVVGIPVWSQISPGGTVVVMSGADGTSLYEIYGLPLFSEPGGGHLLFGLTPTALGDLNGDGFSDFSVGCPGHDDGTTLTSAIHIYSGSDGASLRTILGTDIIPPAPVGSVNLNAGDVDGDGFDDILVDHLDGSLSVLSAATGTVIRSQPGAGLAKGAAGDLNLDGFDDYIATIPGLAGADNTVVAYSGFDGSQLHSVTGPSGGWFGVTAGGLNDLDGDGFPEFFIGEPSSSPGRVHIHSGNTGALIRTYVGGADTEQFGVEVTVIGDLDLDGFDDLVIGAPNPATQLGPGWGGQYDVVSGWDGELISRVISNSHRYFGQVLFAFGDLDGDGVDEIACLTPDPILDVGGILGIYRSLEFFGDTYCAGDLAANCPCGNVGDGVGGCANSAGTSARIGGMGSTSLTADNMTIECSALPSSTPALLFAGAASLGGGAGVPFGDGLLCVGNGIRRLGVQFTSGTGTAAWGSGLHAQGGWAPGDSRYLQVWYRDASGPCSTGANTSNALHLLMYP